VSDNVRLTSRFLKLPLFLDVDPIRVFLRGSHSLKTEAAIFFDNGRSGSERRGFSRELSAPPRFSFYKDGELFFFSCEADRIAFLARRSDPSRGWSFSRPFAHPLSPVVIRPFEASGRGASSNSFLPREGRGF